MVESSRNKSENVDSFNENCVVENVYNGEEAEGFDFSKGGEWIYPINYPVRAYQKRIVSNALFKNTLVCLPTGLGKTFIAAVVMYNYHRWYPNHKVVFMAHSKPLVAQQVNACCNIMGISQSVIAELNGNMQHSNRKKQWENKKIFFLTPQVFSNDLARGNVKAESIRCIVIDEAHKALGNQAYCQVIRAIKQFNSKFRVLALSATPGDDMNMVGEVIQNLMISHLELRNEEDPDIKPYLHEKKVETVVVKLDQQILDIKEMFLKAVDKYIKPLVQYKLLPQSFSAINPFSLVLKQRQFVQDSKVRPELRGLMLSNFSIAISLFHALEELTIHGMRSFVTKLKNLQTGEGTNNKAYYRIAGDEDIKSLIEHVTNILAPDQNISLDGNVSLTRLFDEIDSVDTNATVVYSHPKFAALEKVIQEHFNVRKESTRVIVFCKSRQCTGEICYFLARFKPLVKPMIFVGQSQSSGGIVTKGFNQAAQLTVMKKFREGTYNTLIATCVAEEGLDIGEVDLIINFDSGKNWNTQVQRSGRTGRKRDGRVVNLVTEGKEYQNYNISVSKGKKMNKKLVSDAKNLPFYSGNSRLFPKGITPFCLEEYISMEEVNEEEPIEKRRSKGTKKKAQNAEHYHPSKRMKESGGNGEKDSSFWTVFGGEHSKNSENAKEELKKCSLNEKEATSGSNGRNERPTDSEVEISEIDDQATLKLYNDDVEENVDELWESDEELQVEESRVVKEFFQENNKMLSSKNNFRDLVNLNKINKYCKLIVTGNTDLVDKMKVLANCLLSDNDKKILTSDKLDAATIEKCFNETRRKLLTTVEKDGVNMKEKEKSQVNVTFDIDPEEFFNPLEDFLPEVISSTPVRKNKENLMSPMKNTSVPQLNFQIWNENDFFNLKENFSPKRNTNISRHAQGSSHKNKDLSLISITQALDIVNNYQPNGSVLKKKETDKKDEFSCSPSSPILFFSQKPKTQNKLMPNSPILTQSCRGLSRKCLPFSKTPISKDVLDVKVDEFDNSDLFAETEVALQNHVGELEENLHREERETMKTKKDRESPVRVLTVYSTSSEDPEEHDLGVANLAENSALATFLKTGNKSCATTPPAEEPVNESDISNCKEHVNEVVSGLSRLDFSSFMKNSMTNKREDGPLMESTPVRSRPKLAIDKASGFENTPLSDNPVSSARKSESTKLLKEEKQSFTCNFSLFGDEDFGDECFDIEQFEKTNEERKKCEENLSNVYDEEDRASNDSDIFVNKGNKQNFKSNQSPSPKGGLGDDIENMFDDCDLSDGAMEAIKAVEMYEKNVKPVLKDFDSDDSEDFFVPARRQTKQIDAIDNGPKAERSNITKKKNNRNKGKAPVSEFVEAEAEVSSGDNFSGDEEITSGLDEYDSSFVDERDILSQAQDVDMTAKYLQSTKSPMGVRAGTFKIPKPKIHEELNVFSQMGSEGESEYENDSFCVSEEESHLEVNEISELEVAEVILRDKKKRKRLKDESVASVKKKFRRVLRIESDSSDDDVVEIVAESKTTSARENAGSVPEIQEVFNSSSPIQIGKKSSDVHSNTTDNNFDQEIVIIASRQVANAPEITSCLRAKWNVGVHVRSTPEADYIVSWKVGINRIPLSDFASGNASAKSSLREMIQKLSMNFYQPVVVVEDDKNKGLPLTVGCQKFMWAKHSMKTLVQLLHKNIKVLFSRNKGDTARIVASLCKNEKSRGNFISLTGDIQPDVERRMKFFCSLPGVNVANALRLADEFTSISSFLARCQSVQDIMRKLRLKKEAATSVYQLLYTSPP